MRHLGASIQAILNHFCRGFEYSDEAMKSRLISFLVLAVALMTVAASAQNTPSQPSGEKVEKKDPLFFVKIAADVAGNVQTQSLNGFLGIYIDSQTWPSALKDGDLAPFVKLKEGKAGRSAACLFSGEKDAAVCVFFDGDTPFGVTAAKAAASGKIEANDVAAAYKPITKDMLKKSDKALQFEAGDLNTDDGAPIPGFQISIPVKFSN
jgi:hypothetical protein